jgi:hypothetical protein
MDSLKETAPCNPGIAEPTPEVCQHPPVDCMLGDWTQWGICSAPCGGGSMTRNREVVIPPANMGKSCGGALAEVSACNRAPCKLSCEPVDCAWEAWGSWSACDKCGGQRKRFRHVTSEAHCGGSACPQLPSEETSNCTRKCHELVHCGWGDWQDWSQCSATCGTGSMERTRRLQLVPVFGSTPPTPPAADVPPFQNDFLEERVPWSSEQQSAIAASRLQGLALSFAAGGLVLVAGRAAFRVVRVRASTFGHSDSSVSRSTTAFAPIQSQ